MESKIYRKVNLFTQLIFSNLNITPENNLIK